MNNIRSAKRPFPGPINSRIDVRITLASRPVLLSSLDILIEQNRQPNIEPDGLIVHQGAKTRYGTHSAHSSHIILNHCLDHGTLCKITMFMIQHRRSQGGAEGAIAPPKMPKK